MLNAIQAPYALATPVVECVEDALQAAALEEAAKNVADIIAERERVIKIVLLDKMIRGNNRDPLPPKVARRGEFVQRRTILIRQIRAENLVGRIGVV